MKSISLALFMLVAGCNNTVEPVDVSPTSFSLSGTINGGYDDYIFLGYGSHEDSVRVDNGEFKFSGELDLPTKYAWLHLQPSSTVVHLYLEGSDTQVTIDYKLKEEKDEKLNIVKLKDFQGSKTMAIRDEFRKFWQENNEKSNFNELLYSELETMFRENPKNSFTGSVLGELAIRSSILSISQLKNLHALIDTNYQELDDLEYYKKGLDNLEKYSVGNDFTLFELPNPNDELISNKDLQGKYTLTDFWASWCAPCRAKHPDLLELYSKFDRELFDIVSISIDSDEDKWKNAIEKDLLVWRNLIDIDKEIYDELNIQAIPHSYLLDKDGKIMGMNIPIGMIQEKIQEEFSR